MEGVIKTSTFAVQVERLLAAIKQDKMDARTAELSEAEHRRQLKALYEAHTVRAGQKMEPCQPGCPTCTEVILVNQARAEVG